MKSYDVTRLPSSITLGWDGENNWRPIAFDCSAFLTGHPNAVVTLWLLPKGETQAFPVALVRDGNTVVWTPLNEEMTAESGQLQIVVQDGTDVGKSKVIDYTVHDSLVGGADHPAEMPSWGAQIVAEVTEQADRAEEAASSIDPESISQTVADAVEDYMDEHPVQAPVTSVNGKTGAVTLSASDVGALPDSTVIPTVPQMATDPDMSDWTAGKIVDAATLATDFAAAGNVIATKYTKPSNGIPASDLADGVIPSVPTNVSAFQNDAGYQTAQQVQTAIAAIPAELPTVSASDNGKFFRVVSGEWAADTVPAAEGSAF